MNNDATIHDDFKAWLTSRQYIYSLLQSFYMEGPDEELVRFLQRPDVMSTLRDSINDPLWQLGCDLIIQSPPEPDWRQEYERMLYGPEHLTAPPWESVYLTREKLLYGPPTETVRRTYRLYGFHHGCNEADDHVGIELSFMAFLCTQTFAAATPEQQQEYLDVQTAFITDHLKLWIPLYCQDFKAGSPIPFFQGIACLTQAFIAWDERELQREH